MANTVFDTEDQKMHTTKTTKNVWHGFKKIKYCFTTRHWFFHKWVSWAVLWLHYYSEIINPHLQHRYATKSVFTLAMMIILYSISMRTLSHKLKPTVM